MHPLGRSPMLLALLFDTSCGQMQCDYTAGFPPCAAVMDVVQTIGINYARMSFAAVLTFDRLPGYFTERCIWPKSMDTLGAPAWEVEAGLQS